MKHLLQGLEKTALLPLKDRAEESNRKNGLFYDSKAIEWLKVIPWSKELDPFYNSHMQMGLALRVKHLDDLVMKYINTPKQPFVVKLGLGLSSRRQRINYSRGLWLGVDTLQMIQIRKELDPPTDQYSYWVGSAFSEGWIEEVKNSNWDQLITLAEGLLMYFPFTEVSKMIQKIKANFANSPFIFDVAGSFSEKKTPLGKIQALFQWTLKNADELSQLPLTIKDVKSIFDIYPKRLRMYHLLKWIPAFYNINLIIESEL